MTHWATSYVTLFWSTIHCPFTLLCLPQICIGSALLHVLFPIYLSVGSVYLSNCCLPFQASVWSFLYWCLLSWGFDKHIFNLSATSSSVSVTSVFPANWEKVGLQKLVFSSMPLPLQTGQKNLATVFISHNTWFNVLCKPMQWLL